MEIYTYFHAQNKIIQLRVNNFRNLKLNNLIIIYIHDFVSTLGTSCYPPWRGNHSTCKPEGIRLTKAAARDTGRT